MGVAKGVEDSLVLARVKAVAELEDVEVGWTIVVEKVVSGGVLNDVAVKSIVDDRGEQLLVSAPGPEMGVKSTSSMPKRVPASSVP